MVAGSNGVVVVVVVVRVERLFVVGANELGIEGRGLLENGEPANIVWWRW